jgi:lipid II isoglutaminyl synthase (glutamine-hydrolysing)
LRLTYAGVDPARIEVIEGLSQALDAASADRGLDAPSPPLYVLPTYTAMLELRALLVQRGAASDRWAA